jgi:hypothetical protein
LVSRILLVLRPSAIIHDVMLEIGGLVASGFLRNYLLIPNIDLSAIWTSLILHGITLLRLMSSDNGLRTRILVRLLVDTESIIVLSVIMLHLIVELLSLIKNLHQLIVDLVAVQLPEDMLLMFKLVLGLLGLLSTLLLLDYREGILWLLCLDILAQGLGSFILCGGGLGRRGLMSVDRVATRGQPVVGDGLARVPLDAADAEALLVARIQTFLIIIVQHVHRKGLIWQTIRVIATVLGHLIDV